MSINGLRVAFVQPIIDPVRDAWFRQLAADARVQLRVFALSRQLAHRPGWESRSDAGYPVEFVLSVRIARPLLLPWRRRAPLTMRIVPLDLVWRVCRYRPHAIVVTNATQLVQACIVRALCGARVVLSAEDTSVSMSRLGKTRRLLKVGSLRRADAYCAHSDAARDLLLGLGVPAERVVPTPWAVDNEKFAAWAAASDVTGTRRRFQLDDRIVFVTVASLIPRKGIDHLLSSWGMVPKSLRDRASLLIVGEGPERERLVRMAEASAVDNVRFLGHLPAREVADCLAAADVFVLPTLEDVWGLVVNEAMATGLPVLCSKYAGSSELVHDSEDGFVFDPFDHATLCRLLIRMIEDRGALADMGRRSRQIISGVTIRASARALMEALYRSTGTPLPPEAVQRATGRGR